MFETIQIEAKDLIADVTEITKDLDLMFQAESNHRLVLTGDVFELACLIERFESGNWDIPLDEIEAGRDHVLAQQKIDQYVI